jgi:hypothetical protein
MDLLTPPAGEFGLDSKRVAVVYREVGESGPAFIAAELSVR